MKHIKVLAILLCFTLIFSIFTGCSKTEQEDTPTVKEVKILVIPKFEIDNMSGDFPGEAQLVYEKYMNNAEKLDFPNLPSCSSFYFNEENGMAMLITGSGKTAASISLTSVLSSEDYDFSNALILSIGCGGGSEGFVTYGDVVLETAACDNELGHMADSRDMDNPDSKYTWFYDSSYDSISCVKLDTDLTAKAYELIKDVELSTTETTQRVVKANYGDAEWANRNPKVLKGTILSSDNFWKGETFHNNSVLIAETYGCADPYAITEMEELSIANVVKSFGYLDHLISIRVAVNLDVFLDNESPEILWGTEEAYNEKVSEENSETLDIFEPGMHNLFKVAEVIIDAYMSDSLTLE